MVGSRTVCVWVVLAAIGCGSDKDSETGAGAGGTAHGGAANPAASGGSAGANASGGPHSGGSGGSTNPGAGSAGKANVSGGAGNGGSSSAGGAASGGKGGSGAGGKGGGGAGGTGGAGLPACVSKDDPNAPFNAFQRTSTPAPAATGGPIAAGTYFLTSLTYHGGTQYKDPCLMSQVREILRFTASSEHEGTMHSMTVNMFEDGSGRDEHPMETSYKLEGTTLSGHYICWEPYPYAETYSATSTQVRFIRGPFDSGCDTGVTLELIYDKQP